ncbi:MAG: sigma-70 family RNA polymerase sigma factor [Verrucomicrobiaceae bacterium]|nr:sigma-70 family RNA polymerase sigma factor [Verrucomicrobiaceae bacterium]
MDRPAHDWQKCFQELAPRLILYARQLTASQADAEDVVQLAFVRWWQHNPGADRAHVPLLYAAVRTISMDARRSEERRLRREATVESDEAYFEPFVQHRETAELLARALQELPPEQREVVTLRIWGDLSFAEIATATQASINTVAGRYRYALKALQKVLEPMRADLLEAEPLPA